MQRELNTINKQLKMIHKTFEERRNKHLLKYNLTSSQQEILFYLSHGLPLLRVAIPALGLVRWL